MRRLGSRRGWNRRDHVNRRHVLFLPVRPFISESVAAVPPVYVNTGYIIAGSRHQPACRCYACQMVRRRGREKRLRMELFNCG